MKEFKRRLVPVSICLFIVYFILSFLHPFAIKNNQTAIWLSWTSFVFVLCFGVLILTSKRIGPAPATTFLVGFGIAFVLCTNSGLHLYLTRNWPPDINAPGCATDDEGHPVRFSAHHHPDPASNHPVPWTVGF